MRYSSLKIRKMGPFEDVSIDFDAIDGTLIAIAGGNGVGKTTLLELLTGGIAYRTCRTRGTLAHLATDRNSFVEGTLVNGQRWTIRHTVDCISGKGESLVLDEHGSPALSDGKVSTFSAWSKDRLTPAEVMYASAVSVQQDRGFLSLGRADRMAVLLRVIGAEHLEHLARAARDRGSKASAELDALRARLADAVGHALNVGHAQAHLTACEGKGTVASAAFEAAREALRRADLLAVDSQAANEIRARRQSVVTRLETAKRDLADNEVRAGNNRKLIVEAAVIRTAVARDAVLAKEAQDCQEKSTLLVAESNELARVATAAESKLNIAIRDQTASADASKRANTRLEDKALIDAAIGEVEKRRVKLADLRAQADGIEQNLKDLAARQLSHKDDRIGSLRAGMRAIHTDSSPGSVSEFAGGVLHADDRVVEDAKDVPLQKAHEQTRLEDAGRECTLSESLLESAQKIAARAGEMKAAADDLERSDRNIAELQAVIDDQSPIAAQRRSAAESKAEETERGSARIIAIRDERLGVEKLAKRGKPLDQAEIRIEELAIAHTAMAATYAQLEAELAGLPETKEGGAPDIERQRREVARAEEDSNRQTAAIGEARGQLLRAEEDADRTAQLTAECRALEEELADWKKLALDLGKNGLQSLEIDAAVPTLNTMVNDILTSCVGTRFAVEFKTDRLIASGKELREALDVRVIDNKKGRDALAETYSGGECSIVGEAVALGLTLLGCECMGEDDVTLIRDETGAALDPENRDAYMRMLRHAAKMVGARHVLFVSHDAAMVEAADARILIDDQSNVTISV